jgi:hypothetical protein
METNSPGHDRADSQSEEIKLSFSLTRRDILNYNLHFNRGLIYMTIILGLLLIPGLILAFKYHTGDSGMFFMWLAIGVGMALVMCFSSLSAIFIQVYYIKGDVVEKAMEFRSYIINSAGIAIFTSNSQLIRSWKDIIKAVESKHGFYLRTSDKAAIIIPHHVVESVISLENLKQIIGKGKSGS